MNMRVSYKVKNMNKANITINMVYSVIKTLYKYIREINIENNELIIRLRRSNDLLIVLNILNKHYKYQFKEVVNICTVDNLTIKNRFEISYLLLSLKYKFRIRIKININETTHVPSIVSLYPGANWLERENWDMFGIYFINNPDLRRILTDYGFEGFPFRKDFPVNGYVEAVYDDENNLIGFEKLENAQEIRTFEFSSPWLYTRPTKWRTDDKKEKNIKREWKKFVKWNKEKLSKK